MKVIIYTDGGARGNPGPAGIGVSISSEEGKVLDEIAEFIGTATNNVAEYKALIAGLKKAHELGAQELVIRMDSELIVKQMLGLYRIKDPSLRDLAQEVFNLKKYFHKVQFIHIPRSMNKVADSLVNRAVDLAERNSF